jgi:hypothetical protein
MVAVAAQEHATQRVCTRKLIEEKEKVVALITKAGGPDAFCSDNKNQEKYPKFCKKVMDLIVQVSLCADRV